MQAIQLQTLIFLYVKPRLYGKGERKTALKLKYKVFSVQQSECCKRHISVLAKIEEKICEENIRIPIVEKPEIEFAKKITGQIQMHITEMGLSPPKREDPESTVMLLLTEAMFDMLGRPTIGDYIDLQALTLVKGSSEHPDYVPPEAEPNI